MCGIGGVINVSTEHVKAEQVFRDTLKERGPDYFGVYRHEGMSLFHGRLSIIDLSADANQPMIDPQTGNVLVFNGEIYNFLTLKSRLETEGIRFATRSDTEVLLKAYALWGIEKTLQAAEGMFAFSLYDRKADLLILARDRFGKKPLYYRHTSGDFSFSSNIVSLSRLFRNALTINYQVYDYFLRELAMPQPHTIWEEVYQLPPASWMTLDIGENKLSSPQRYWSLAGLKTNHTITEREALEKTESLLYGGIRKRLVSDVPLGFFLSGGIDSGLIVSMASEMSNKPVTTFTVGFDDKASDETPEAKLLADKYGTDHNEIRLEPDVKASAEKIIAYTGEPFADYSLIPSFEICRAINKHATVALSGDGGDELFGGYKHYVDYYASAKFSSQAFTQLRLNLSKVGSRLLPSKFVNVGAAQAFMGMDEPQIAALRINGLKDLGLRTNELIRDESVDFTGQYIRSTTTHYFEGSSPATRQQLSSLDKLLLNNYLVKVDRASMANSLEIRSPFLDHQLAEFAFTLPDHLKIKNFRAKYLLKKIACKRFERNVFKEVKRGFQIPLGSWLQGELKPWAEELLFDSLVKRGLFDQKYMERIWQEHLQKRNHTDLIWKLMSLELWYTHHYDQ